MGHIKLNRDNLLLVYSRFKKFNDDYLKKYGFQKLLEIFGNRMWDWEKLIEKEIDEDNIGKTQELKHIRYKALMEALEANNWIQQDAAKQLGISPRVVNYMVKEFGIKHPTWKKNV